MNNNFILYTAVFLLGFFGLFTASQLPGCKSEDPLHVKILPLDSRPANYYVPQKLAELSGMEPNLPPRSYLGDLKESGDIEKLNQWLTETGPPPDLVIVSVDMLAFGGLVPSREYQALSQREINARLLVLANIKDSFPQTPVYAYSSIQRLAPTVHQAEDLETAERIRRWAILRHRVELPPHELDADPQQIEEELWALEAAIPSEKLDSYQKSREENLQINEVLLKYLKAGHLDHLLIGLDDAQEHGLHHKEQAKLEEEITELELSDQVDIYAGLDELDGVLMARFLSEYTNESLSFYVEYRGSEALTQEWIPTYETKTIAESVQRHVASAGGELTEDKDQADIVLYVNTPLLDQGRQKQGKCENAFTAEIKKDLDRGYQVAVADVEHINRTDKTFIQQLYQQVDITDLIAFSGWNTAGNTLGQAVAQATARYHVTEGNIQLPEAPDTEHAHPGKKAAAAQAEYLFHRFLKDHHYRNQIMPRAENLVNILDLDPQHMSEDYHQIETYVKNQLQNTAADQFDRFNETVLPAGDKNKSYRVKALEDMPVRLPWKRLFEVDIEPKFTLEESAD